METHKYRSHDKLEIDGVLGPITIAYLQRLLALQTDGESLIEETGCWDDETVNTLKTFLKKEGF